MFPLLTLAVHEAIRAARAKGEPVVHTSLDLGRSVHALEVHAQGWSVDGTTYPDLPRCKARTIYGWEGETFVAASRFGDFGLIKLVPTDRGPPSFEIDGIKMLPTAQVCPFEDAARKVGLVEPAGKIVLDTCAGLGYFAHWCRAGGARHVLSFERDPAVLWLRGFNPWSPPGDADRLELRLGDVGNAISALETAAFDAVLHDPPRFGIAGDLYSQAFYDQLARVLRPGGRLFHYTGTPNALTSGRDVPREVSTRLQRAGFTTDVRGDGVLARRRA